MNKIQSELLALSQRQDLSMLGLRETARLLNVKNPETIKYHLRKLREAGLLNVASSVINRIEKNKLGSSDLITIPIRGSANCGPATHYATNDIEGYIKVSSSLLKTKNYADLYALRATGTSMDQAHIDGKPVVDGDYVIVDGSQREAINGRYVVAVIDNLANIKKVRLDKANEQLVLLSESSDEYLPIFIHPDDSHENLVSGLVVQVIRKPRIE